MARQPRKRVALSFSDGHRLAPAFTAAGLGPVPTAADVRALIELGLAARSAGLMSVRAPHGGYQLVQAFSGGVHAEGATIARLAPAAQRAAPEPGAASPADGAKNLNESSKGGAGAADTDENCFVHAGRGTSAPSIDEGGCEDGARGDAGSEMEIDPETRSLLSNALNF